MEFRKILLLFGMISAYPVVAFADFYRYYDENGGVNITNDYKSIPERHRASVTVTTDKQLVKKAQARKRQELSGNGRTGQEQRPPQLQSSPGLSIPQESPAVSSQTLKESKAPPDKNSSSWLSRQLPLLKVMGIIALLVVGFVVASRLASALAPRSLAIVIKFAMLAAIGVFVTKGFSEKIADAFARIKDESNIAQKAVDKRSEKIQQQAE